MKKSILTAMYVIISSLIFAQDTFDIDKSCSDFSKWKILNASIIGATDAGNIQMLLTSGQPMFFTPKISINADKAKKVSFTTKVMKGDNQEGNVLFITKEYSNWDDKKIVHFRCVPDGELHTYEIDMSTCPLWKGEVTALRITPLGLYSRFESTSKDNRYIEFGSKMTGIQKKPFVWELDDFGIKQTFDSCSVPVQDMKGTKPIEYDLMMKNINRNADIVFLGDSITWGWVGNNNFNEGIEIWDEFLKPMNAQNCALVSDRTQHTLWQITNGKVIESFEKNPRLFVVMIGVNNILAGDPPASIAKAIENIVKVLKKKVPDSRILLLSILPINIKNTDSSKYNTQIAKVNSIIGKSVDNKSTFFLDMTKSFIGDDGKNDEKLFTDGLHLTESGYQRWHDVMMPKIIELLNIN